MPADTPSEPRPQPEVAEPGRWYLPLWLLQILELSVAYLLISQSVHVVNGVLLAASGIVLGLLTLSLKAPLGAMRIIDPRMHLVAIRLLALAMALALVVPAARPDLEGLVIVVFSAVVLVLLSTRTATTVGRWGRRSSRTSGPVIDATATVVPPDGIPADQDTPDSALRRVGRTTGAAAAVGKQVVDQHRPQVEDQVRRTLRGAGKFAGRLTRSKVRPPDPPD